MSQSVQQWASLICTAWLCSIVAESKKKVWESIHYPMMLALSLARIHAPTKVVVLKEIIWFSRLRWWLKIGLKCPIEVPLIIAETWRLPRRSAYASQWRLARARLLLRWRKHWLRMGRFDSQQADLNAPNHHFCVVLSRSRSFTQVKKLVEALT